MRTDCAGIRLRVEYGWRFAGQLPFEEGILRIRCE